MVRIDCPECLVLMEHLRIDPPTRAPVLLDACFKCGGIWFDKGELSKASKVAPHKEQTSEKSELRCPRCKERMFLEPLGDAGAAAFSCARCRGLWATGEAVDVALKLHRTGAVGADAAPPPPAPRFAGESICVRCHQGTFGCNYRFGEGWLCTSCFRETSPWIDDRRAGEQTKRLENWLMSWLD